MPYTHCRWKWPLLFHVHLGPIISYMTDIVWPLFNHNIVCTLMYVNFVLIWEMPILDNLHIRVHKLSITEISTGFMSFSTYMLYNITLITLLLKIFRITKIILYYLPCLSGLLRITRFNTQSRFRVIFLALWKVVRLLQNTTPPWWQEEGVVGDGKDYFQKFLTFVPCFLFCSLNLWTKVHFQANS